MPKTFYEKIKEEVLDNFDSLIIHQSVINNNDNNREKKQKYMKEKQNYEKFLILIDDKLDEIKLKNSHSKSNRKEVADEREYEHTNNFLKDTESKVKELIEDINKKMEILNGGSHHRKTKRHSNTKRNTKKKRHSKTKRH
jgi:hypothetical protein